MLSEFELISQYFTRARPNGPHTVLGVGDDCALLAAEVGQQLAISSDMLVAGRHFFADADPRQLGHKCLAVNLSDLAAMGAKPVAFTLALALPNADANWLQAFSSGMFALADSAACELIGGDTTKGPLNICITIFGHVPAGQSLRRDAAQIGDEIWVSGSLGDARLALAGLQGEIQLDAQTLQHAAPRLHSPSPRNALGLGLRQIAHAAVDISDGLIGDLGHILQKSQVGARLHLSALPVGPMLASQPRDRQLEYMLTGGDDYELCFTAPASKHQQVLQVAQTAATPVTCIGKIDAGTGLQLLNQHGQPEAFSFHSFDHFRQP